MNMNITGIQKGVLPFRVTEKITQDRQKWCFFVDVTYDFLVLQLSNYVNLVLFPEYATAWQTLHTNMQ